MVMVRLRITRLFFVAILTLVAVLSLGRPALADTLILPAGVACSFPLAIDISGGNQIHKEFLDKNGNVVRMLSAGRGVALTLTNTDTSATLSLQSNGSVSHTTFNPDGSRTEVATGHNLLIFFPSDDPPGPSTTLYVGKVVYTVSPTGEVFTLQQFNGQATDICAALS
jgi:hypothetical protein